MDHKESYLAVDPDFIEILHEMVSLRKSGKVHFFNAKGELDDAEGVMNSTVKETAGEFLCLSSNQRIRIDRIITVLGRPGPAYDEYDAYANACLNCSDEGQFYSLE